MTNKTNQIQRSQSSWSGVGFWNVYFILKFALAAFGYLNLHLLYNALLLVGVAFPIPWRALRVLRTIVAVALGMTLLYSESWLPSLESVMSNAGNIADFSFVYLVEIVAGSINWTMIGIGVLVALIYLFVKDWFRVTTVTVLYLVWLFVQPYWQAWHAETPKVPTNEMQALNQTETVTPMGPAQVGTRDSKNIDHWLTAFYKHEESRHTVFPESLGTKPFDVLLVNICSLSNDDLVVAKLTDHAVLKRFDVYFDAFNSATAYSGPATLRLLVASCGQPSHKALYNGRRLECELLNRLKSIGYEQQLYMDHQGKFDDYLTSLKTRGGLDIALAPQSQYRIRYTGFDGDVVYDDADVFDEWVKTLGQSVHPRVTLMNLIALHDGNRQRGTSREMPFAPRAALLLDQLQGLMNSIEQSGRRVMMVVVPEHGAAVRGDTIQMARLRDIPSPHITQVPVMVKYFGMTEKMTPVHVKENTSYLALSELIARSIETDVYAKFDPLETIRGLAKSLPQTYPVSENSNAAVIRFQDRYFVRLNNRDWLPYQQ